MSLHESSATQLLGELESGALSAVEVAEAFFGQIDQHEGTLHSFVSSDRDAALASAEDIDHRRKTGKPVGRLAGLPVAVKDVLCTRSVTTTCGSRMLEHFVPPYDATVIAKLKAADAVFIGRTNMDEFAMGSSTENSAFGHTKNPWNTLHIPGGSSGGSAACLAASMAPLSIGTDTGGSIRQPAAYCGVTGMKPTYGRVSRYGLVAFASSLDQVGPLARTAEDAALLLEVIAGHDERDSTSANLPVPEFTQRIVQPLENLCVGLVQEHFGEGLDPEIDAATREAIKVLESLGATVKQISMPHNKFAIATYYIIAPCEASSNLARYDGAHYGFRTDEQQMMAELKAEQQSRPDEDGDGPLVRMYRKTRAEGFGAEVKRRIMLGTYALSSGYYDAYYVKALKVRRLIRQDYDDAFKEVDLIIGPTTPSAAFKIGEKSGDPLSMYLEDLYTVSANLAGVCGISIPCGFTSAGLPVGVQMQAPAFEEERLLRAAHMYQQATDWHTRKPVI